MFNGHKWWHKVARTGSYNDLKDKPTILKSYHSKITTDSISANSDYNVTFPLPSGWSKIELISFSAQPKDTWNSHLLSSPISYNTDDTVTIQFHNLGSDAQQYIIHYSVIGY